MTEAKATVRYLRMSPRKVRLVADLLRGKPVAAAEALLCFRGRAACVPLLKLLRCAQAAALGLKMEAEQLYLKSIRVDGGPTLKRFRARAYGRAASIRKRTSHVTIVLAEKTN